MTPHTSCWQLLSYAIWFAKRDLFERSAFWVTLAVVAATAVFTAASTIALALPWVTTEIRIHRLSQDPWARCVWVWPSNSLHRELTDERLAQLRATARVATGEDDPSLVVCGFHHVKYWFRMDGGNREYAGRTVSADDPLLPAVKRLLREGEGFDDPEAEGIVLSPMMAEQLGVHAGSVIELFDDDSGRIQKVKVVGVTRDALPLGHEFLLTEAEDSRLRVPEEKLQVVWSGPLADKWPGSWNRFPEDTRKAFQRLQIAVEVATFEQEPAAVLMLTARKPLPTETWRAHLLKLGKDMERYQAAPDFATVRVEWAKDKPRATLEAKPRGAYTRATIYVHPLKLYHLRPAANAARSMGLYANDAARVLVDEIEMTAVFARSAVIGLVGAFCAAGFVALGLALYLRGAQQAAQIGVLRAMGATTGALRWIIVVEAALMWLIGTVFGLVLAVVCGAALCWGYGVSWSELKKAGESGSWAWFVCGFLVVSLLGCVLGNWVATRPFRARPAAEALGLTS